MPLTSFIPRSPCVWDRKEAGIYLFLVGDLCARREVVEMDPFQADNGRDIGIYMDSATL